ncbi:hypothetical protein KUCAC02_013106 [Chaenocephalus aceratus]|uniref:Uncharacterized protein n=1 Tax=Chaenocephalus aceratus TaxID=36190 RepID=A0ACB9XDK7_CHAAC|nr:hypothetical protein KUCAC02_013106 [Chaenocephalus aceratus]
MAVSSRLQNKCLLSIVVTPSAVECKMLLSSWYNAGGAAAPTTTPEPPPYVPPNCPPCAGATLTAWTPDPSIWRPDQQAGSPMCSTAGALLEWVAELHATTCSLHPPCLVFFIGLDKLNIGRLISPTLLPGRPCCPPPPAVVVTVERWRTSCVQMLSMRPRKEEHPVSWPKTYGLKRRTHLERLALFSGTEAFCSSPALHAT